MPGTCSQGDFLGIVGVSGVNWDVAKRGRNEAFYMPSSLNNILRPILIGLVPGFFPHGLIGLISSCDVTISVKRPGCLKSSSVGTKGTAGKFINISIFNEHVDVTDKCHISLARDHSVDGQYLTSS